jgi:hypothetical protein
MTKHALITPICPFLAAMHVYGSSLDLFLRLVFSEKSVTKSGKETSPLFSCCQLYLPSSKNACMVPGGEVDGGKGDERTGSVYSNHSRLSYFKFLSLKIALGSEGNLLN